MNIIAGEAPSKKKSDALPIQRQKATVSSMERIRLEDPEKFRGEINARPKLDPKKYQLIDTKGKVLAPLAPGRFNPYFIRV